VRDDVEASRRSELIREDITVSGAIYDVHTGERRKVVRS
jgi:carbonic anhydrase